MKKNILSFIILSFLLNTTFGQRVSKQIEITPYLQWDNYPSFTFQLNSIRNNTVKIKGTSWGIRTNYKFSFKKNLYAKFGVGYYKYSFNDIRKYDHLFGVSSARDINYPDGSSTYGYVCDNYLYNTITLNLGLEKLFILRKNINFIGGFDIINYYTFSQQYNIPGSYNNREYKKTNTKYFGYSFNLYTGVEKKFGKIKIDPTLILPIYKIWKQDVIFPQEENNRSRSKWLRGIGVGVTFIYSLN